MTFRSVFLAIVIAGFIATGAVAQDEFTQKDARDMAFSEMSEDKQKQVIAMLKKLMKDSKGKAEESIRENGSIVPYGYVLNPQGEGQFLHMDPEQKLKAEVTAHAIQKSILTNAVRGNLVASGLYMTMGMPRGLEKETREKLEESLEGDRTLEDVRFLLVELQHLGGLGLVTTIPYWKDDEDKWVFGEPAQQKVEPSLQSSVQNQIQKAAERQKKKQAQGSGS